MFTVLKPNEKCGFVPNFCTFSPLSLNLLLAYKKLHEGSFSLILGHVTELTGFHSAADLHGKKDSRGRDRRSLRYYSFLGSLPARLRYKDLMRSFWRLFGLFNKKFWVLQLCKFQWFSRFRKSAPANINSGAAPLCAFFREEGFRRRNRGDCVGWLSRGKVEGEPWTPGSGEQRQLCLQQDAFISQLWKWL